VLVFRFTPSAEGLGLAPRAIRLFASWLFEECGIERIFGLTDVDNGGAQRAMERAGMVREGVLRGYDRRPSGRADLVSYSVLSTDAR
jgi:RimJ/RimL family protein N-acetyltransferase